LILVVLILVMTTAGQPIQGLERLFGPRSTLEGVDVHGDVRVPAVTRVDYD